MGTQLSQCWANAMIWLRIYPTQEYLVLDTVWEVLFMLWNLFWEQGIWKCLGFQFIEPHKSAETLPQAAVVRSCSGSVHLASTLQKSSAVPLGPLVEALWDESLRVSSSYPLLWAKTKWRHCCFSPMSELNETLVKAMARLCQRTPFCSLREIYPGNSSFQSEKYLLCLKCNMIKRSEISSTFALLSQEQSLRVWK